MKNLQKIGVQEISLKEKVNIQGGDFYEDYPWAKRAKEWALSLL